MILRSHNAGKKPNSHKTTLAALLSLTILVGCGNSAVAATTPNRVPPQESQSGTDMEIYLLDDKLVDANGIELADDAGNALYTLSTDGSAIDATGEMVLSEEELSEFTCITELTAYEKSEEKKADIKAADEYEFEIRIPTCTLEDGSEVYTETTSEIVLKAGPDDTVNREFTVISTDPNTVTMEKVTNAETEEDTAEAASQDETVVENQKGETDLKDTAREAAAEDDGTEDENEEIEEAFERIVFFGSEEHILKITAVYAGEVKLLVTNCLGETVAVLNLEIKPEEVKEEAVESVTVVVSCRHKFTDYTIGATETAGGYTQHTCGKCGYTYRDSYRDKLPCTHTYISRNVNATCNSPGYVLQTCSKCGDSQKTGYTDALVHSYDESVVAPTCSAEGYTIHTCTRCGHSYRDNTTAKIDHKYSKKAIEAMCTVKGYTEYTCTVCEYTYKGDYSETSNHRYTSRKVAATCNSEGYTEYICTVCGHSYKDNTVAKTEHTYAVTTVSPTYSERGYDLHTCTACGYVYKDNYRDVLVCTNHNYTEADRTDATCEISGYINSVCANCGLTSAAEIPAKGHSYTLTSGTEATCESGATATYTCSVCGKSYHEETAALGHDFSVVRSYQGSNGWTPTHAICNDCGLDMTAAGIDIGAHQTWEVDNGHSGSYTTARQPIYCTVTFYDCSRCGQCQNPNDPVYS